MSSFLQPCRVLVALRPASQLSTPNRHFSSTSRVLRRLIDEGDDDADPNDEDSPFETLKYDTWISEEGLKWKQPDPLGPKWLGDTFPFPLNPTFKPPTPLSDKLRTEMYSSYVTDPVANDVHTLSTRYGVSMKRVEAILRLKELEARWQEAKPLQTGFLVGMERILGVNVGGRQKNVSDEISSSERDDVNEADELSRLSASRGERNRGLVRTYFESVDEGKEAVLPRLLDEAREKFVLAKAKRVQYPTTVVQPDLAKPAYKFVDVGLRWFDPKDTQRRQKESARRKAIKAGRRATKLAKAAPA